MIEKNRIQELINVFYQQPFKIFYVNSEDCENFVKPKGLFISLGITTSMKTLESIGQVIANTYPESTPRVAELKSRCISGNQFLNTITDNSNPQPYTISELPKNAFTRDEAIQELDRLRGLIKSSGDLDAMVLTQKLQELVDKFDQVDGWDDLRILKVENDYKTFHTIANYKKEGEFEYRIGIYVG